MIILAIDTSCDDTCVAILKIACPVGSRRLSFGENCKLKILSNIVSSQVKLHAKYGGVWPFLAKREHQKNLPIVLKRAIKEARSPEIVLRQAQDNPERSRRVDLVAVTIGPGLEPCLWVGVNFAKDLAKKLKLPIIPINHIEAHIIANFLNLKSKILNLKSIFPAICLVVSGGHTQLILMKDFGDYKILGETRDDAAGECFDKVARTLRLGYPGGPAISAEVAKFKISNLKFKIGLPRPMIYQKNYDFSFSGLKTAVFYDFKNRSPKIRKSKTYIREMAKEVQQAIVDVLISKSLRAAKEYNAKSIILGGGVTANEELRKQFKYRLKTKNSKLNFLVPPKNLCTDNAAMVAVTAYFHWPKDKTSWQKIEARANLRI